MKPNMSGLRRCVIAAFPLAVLAVTGGCPLLPEEVVTPPPGQLVQSEKSRQSALDVPAADVAELVAGNTAFALDLYGQVRSDPGNVFYSPYSISVALGMTYAGARGETEAQMADALRFTLGQDRLHPAFNAVDLALASRGEGASATDGEGFELNVVNKLWGQIGFAFRDEFLDVLAQYYGAGMSLLDFSASPEPSRVAINDWVSDVTRERIEDLIPFGVITPDTRLVLTNAIYFNAAWADPFDPADTRDGAFFLLDGSEVLVPFMSGVAMYGYATGDGYETVELPYEGQELSMVVIVPDAGRFEEFEDGLSTERLQALVSELRRERLQLSMPKFTFSWETSLKTVLSDLGMPIAFEGAADFSGMADTATLAIQDVIHQAFVAVDEEGTEAAAATAVVIGETSVPVDPLIVTVDRPFVFFIRDIETGTILFLGRVVNPAS